MDCEPRWSKQTSPVTSPDAPQERPRKAVPSSKTSRAGSPTPLEVALMSLSFGLLNDDPVFQGGIAAHIHIHGLARELSPQEA